MNNQAAEHAGEVAKAVAMAKVNALLVGLVLAIPVLTIGVVCVGWAVRVGWHG